MIVGQSIEAKTKVALGTRVDIVIVSMPTATTATGIRTPGRCRLVADPKVTSFGNQVRGINTIPLNTRAALNTRPVVK